MAPILKKIIFHWTFPLLLVLLVKSSHCLPPWISDCIVDGQECKLTGENLISVTKNVTSIGECAKVCAGISNCTDFTHFGNEAFPFSNACMTLSSCPTLSACTDCSTATTNPDCTCSIPYEGKADNSIFVTSADNEKECKHVCNDHQGCEVYTYYTNTSDFSKLCILFGSSGLEHPAQHCQYCKTGPVACFDNSECKVFLIRDDYSGDITSSHKKFTSGANKIYLETGERGCSKSLSALLVGGGGGMSRGFGGGGSGRIQALNLTLQQGLPMTFNVGNIRESTTVLVDGLVIAEAPSGDSPAQDQTKGCDGYSGGGGGTGGRGGEDGENGGDGANGGGGAGTGVKVAELGLQHFNLTAGRGGEPTGFFGGGGGGVLVDGVGPTFSQYQGVGYGGGGGGVSGEGLPGVVLIEL